MRSEAPPSSAMSLWRWAGDPLELVATTVSSLSRASLMIAALIAWAKGSNRSVARSRGRVAASLGIAFEEQECGQDALKVRGHVNLARTQELPRRLALSATSGPSQQEVLGHICLLEPEPRESGFVKNHEVKHGNGSQNDLSLIR